MMERSESLNWVLEALARATNASESSWRPICLAPLAGDHLLLRDHCNKFLSS